MTDVVHCDSWRGVLCCVMSTVC